MVQENLFSPSLSIISVEKLVSVDFSNKQQETSFSGLREAQRFFCDFLPIAATFVHEFSSIRTDLQNLLAEDDREKKKAGLKTCDSRLAQAHIVGVEFVTRWARDYFTNSHHFARSRDDVTATVRYFYKDSDNRDIARVIKSYGPRKVETNIRVADDASLVAYKRTADTRAEHRIGAFICPDLVEWTLQDRFFHPSLHEGNHAARSLLQNAYHSGWNKFLFRKHSKRLTPNVLEQWRACWKKSDEMISSLAVFPITLANNKLEDSFIKGFAPGEQNFDTSEVFGVISLETSSPYAFNVGDVLMGRIWADALFAFTGTVTHYTNISRLRKEFGDVDYDIALDRSSN